MMRLRIVSSMGVPRNTIARSAASSRCRNDRSPRLVCRVATIGMQSSLADALERAPCWLDP